MKFPPDKVVWKWTNAPTHQWNTEADCAGSFLHGCGENTAEGQPGPAVTSRVTLRQGVEPRRPLLICTMRRWIRPGRSCPALRCYSPLLCVMTLLFCWGICWFCLFTSWAKINLVLTLGLPLTLGRWLYLHAKMGTCSLHRVFVKIMLESSKHSDGFRTSGQGMLAFYFWGICPLVLVCLYI